MPTVSVDQNSFCKWLNRYLTENGMSDIDFATMVGVDNSLVGKYRRGERTPTFQTLRLIIVATGVLASEFFNEEGG